MNSVKHFRPKKMNPNPITIRSMSIPSYGQPSGEVTPMVLVTFGWSPVRPPTRYSSSVFWWIDVDQHRRGFLQERPSADADSLTTEPEIILNAALFIHSISIYLSFHHKSIPSVPSLSSGTETSTHI